MRETRGERAVAYAALGAVFGAIFLYVSMPLFSVDLWWHLASGRWVWEHRALMREDPFNFVSFPSDLPLWRKLTFTQYWLSQLMLYATYLAAGFKGVLLTRAAVITGAFATLYVLMRRNGAGRAVAVAFLWLAAVVTVRELTYVEARPQMWTTLFAPLAVLLLDEMRRGGRGAHFALPALMLLWANMHAGFVLGALVIAIYAGTALVLRRGATPRAFYASCAGALLATVLTPGGYVPFLAVMKSLTDPTYASVWSSIVEGQSLLSHTTAWKALRGLPFLSALIALTALFFLARLHKPRGMVPEHALLLLLVFAMGIKSIRYLIFFVQIAAFVSAVNATRAVELLTPGRLWERAGRLSTAVLLVVSLLVAVDLGRVGLRRTGLLDAAPYNTEYMGAVRFMRENGLTGNVMNDYAYGGYLMWWLGPEVKVMIDERILSREGFELFQSLVMSPFQTDPLSGRPLYAATFDRYGVEIAVLPGCDKVSGVAIPLTYGLLTDPRWAIAYADRALIVFIRETPARRAFLARHRLPPEAGYRNMLYLATEALRGGHGSDVNARLSLAIAHMGLGDKENARAYISEYLRLRPGDEGGLYFRGLIEKM
jgi:hypothetical protein